MNSKEIAIKGIIERNNKIRSLRKSNAALSATRRDLLAALEEIYELCGEVLKRQPNAGEFAHNMAAGLRGKVRAAIANVE